MARLHLYRPLDESQPIWRYMDFPRFMSLLVKKSLYFHPALFLRKQEPFEFRIPVKHMSIARENIINQLVTDGESPERASELAKDWTSQEHSLYHWAVNCWTFNPIESYALWRTFVPTNEGVAIKSSVERLRSALDPTRLIYGGLVDYIDYASEEFTPNGHSIGFEQVFHKAKFYEHEREFRLVTIPDFFPGQYINEQAFSHPTTFESLSVSVDLNDLIDEIKVSPYAAPWFFNLVQDIVNTYASGRILVTDSAMKSVNIFEP